MKRLSTTIIFLLIAGVLALVCFHRRERPYNVVLVSIDTLRHDHLGCYGYPRDTSPAIDRLAREGVLFETAVSSTTWTLPAHVALLTSLPDVVHGVLWDTDAIDGNRVTLTEILRDNGYRTGGVFTGPYLLPRFGFEQGFDSYIDATLYDKKLAGSDVLVASKRGRTTPGAMDKVEEWLEQEQDKPFFLFIHLFDAHPDFDPPAPYDTMFDPDYTGKVSGKGVFHNEHINKSMDPRDLDHLVALYDGEIRFVDDAGITRLVSALTERKLIKRTLIIITSDHGEEFFEHGEFGHRLNLYDTTLRIPLIIWRPGLVPSGTAVKEQVRIIDVMPTILDLLGLPLGGEELGQSLRPLMEGRGRVDARPAYAVLIGGSINLEALRADAYKLVLNYKTKERALYDLANDPGESRPMTDPSAREFRAAMERYGSMRQALSSYRESIPQGESEAPPLDAETRERLKSLGYFDD
jgi:arylsulfatase A-like enzyme